MLIELRRNEHYSYRSISRELGRSPNTIRNEYLRGQKQGRIANRNVVYYDPEWNHNRYSHVRVASRKS